MKHLIWYGVVAFAMSTTLTVSHLRSEMLAPADYVMFGALWPVTLPVSVLGLLFPDIGRSSKMAAKPLKGN